MESLEARLNAKAQQQADEIKKGFARLKQPIVIESVPAIDRSGNPTDGISFMYPADPAQILVRADSLPEVMNILGQEANSVTVKPIIGDVVLLTISLQDFGKKNPDILRPTVLDALDAVDERLGEGVATPDHVLTVCDGVVSPCPATEPRVVDFGIEPDPGVCTGNSGAGVLIYIADTGLLKDTESHSWLQGVERALDRNGQVQDWDWPLDPGDGTGHIPTPYTGHGTFVAGVVRCMAPQAEVIVSNICKVAGSVLESDFVLDLKAALGLGVDIFHLSIAAPTRKDLPLLAFERWLALVDRYKGTVCVAAAGNSGVRSPTWPSVFPQTVSVGALTRDGRDRADFSNYGGWVDVYAPGRDIINAYASGTYTYHDWPYKDEDVKFYGMARWSGTSFSTPIVTGLIAARMSVTGEDGRQAAAALLREARSQAIAGVGAILMPCDGKVSESPAPRRAP